MLPRHRRRSASTQGKQGKLSAQVRCKQGKLGAQNLQLRVPAAPTLLGVRALAWLWLLAGSQ